MATSADEDVIFATRFSKKLFVKPNHAGRRVRCDSHCVPEYPLGVQQLRLLVLPGVGGAGLHSSVLKVFAFPLRHHRQEDHHSSCFIARRSYEMLLSKVESIEVDQTLSDRLIWGSGTLTITGTGGTKETFPNVGEAIKFQEHLNDILHAN